VNLIGGGCNFDDHQIILKDYHMFIQDSNKSHRNRILEWSAITFEKELEVLLMKTAAHDVGNPPL
jgi:hypothetical protein